MQSTPTAEAILAGDRRALAKAITLVESQRVEDRAIAQSLLNTLLPHTGKSIRVGVTGVPGVGKSTFCAAATSELSELSRFQGSLTPHKEWDVPMMVAWAQSLGTDWCQAAAKAIEAGGVVGSSCGGLIVKELDGDHSPSEAMRRQSSKRVGRRRA